MEILLAVVSWLTTILLGLVLLSLPVDAILKATMKEKWKDSKAKDVYDKAQIWGLGIFAVLLMITIVVMLT